jgi:hypothetical protein
MRAAFAPLLGLLLLWTQALAAVSPHVVEQTVACQCCRCGNAACATQTSVPAPSPAPVNTAPSAAERQKTTPPEADSDLLFAAALSLSSLLDPSDLSVSRRPTPDAVAAASLPSILRRHGILLI